MADRGISPHQNDTFQLVHLSSAVVRENKNPSNPNNFLGQLTYVVSEELRRMQYYKTYL